MIKLSTLLNNIIELGGKSRNHMLLQYKMKVWIEWTILFALLRHTVYK